jgi:hypothetical protein
LWQEEFAGIRAYMDEFGDRLPRALHAELADALRRVQTP